MLSPHDFLGEWSVERVIDDRQTCVPGRFEGRASFTPEDDALRYREAGTLRLGTGQGFAASRENLWRWHEGEVAVAFADGRPFHRFRPEAAGAGTDHPCGDDLYRVRYDFTAWPHWAAEWEVAGPAKAYRMRSRYARA